MMTILSPWSLRKSLKNSLENSDMKFAISVVIQWTYNKEVPRTPVKTSPVLPCTSLTQSDLQWYVIDSFCCHGNLALVNNWVSVGWYCFGRVMTRAGVAVDFTAAWWPCGVSDNSGIVGFYWLLFHGITSPYDMDLLGTMYALFCTSGIANNEDTGASCDIV